MLLFCRFLSLIDCLPLKQMYCCILFMIHMLRLVLSVYLGTLGTYKSGPFQAKLLQIRISINQDNIVCLICHVNHMASNTSTLPTIRGQFSFKTFIISSIYEPYIKTWIIIVLLRHFTVAFLNFELLQLFVALFTWNTILFLYLQCKFYGLQ